MTLLRVRGRVRVCAAVFADVDPELLLQVALEAGVSIASQPPENAHKEPVMPIEESDNESDSGDSAGSPAARAGGSKSGGHSADDDSDTGKREPAGLMVRVDSSDSVLSAFSIPSVSSYDSTRTSPSGLGGGPPSLRSLNSHSNIEDLLQFH
jgi:hypothetical protein